MLRLRRQFIGLFSHKTVFKPSAAGSNSHIQMRLGDSALNKIDASPGQTGQKTASQLFESSGEIIRVPIKWLQHLQDNWLIYIVCAAIICLSILFFYCLIRRFVMKKGDSNKLVDLAYILGKQQQQPPSARINQANMIEEARF